jgi:hypothetical protein
MANNQKDEILVLLKKNVESLKKENIHLLTSSEWIFINAAILVFSICSLMTFVLLLGLYR